MRDAPCQLQLSLPVAHFCVSFIGAGQRSPFKATLKHSVKLGNIDVDSLTITAGDIVLA